MAKVKITGHASGTGILTVTAPNTSTDRTITLPDATGTLLTEVADDAITLAKMASGTDGNIISYDASGNPVAIATGNDGQVLTSTGAGSPPAFEDATGGEDGLTNNSNTTWMTVSSDEEVNMPLQPCFSVNLSAEDSNLSAGAYDTVPFDTEIYDIGSNFNTGTYTFTAPVTGKYFISLHFKMEEIQNDASYIRFLLTTSNRGYSAQIDPRVFDTDGDFWSVYITQLCDMDASDTAYARLKQIGGTSAMDLGTETMMTGILIA